MKMLLALALSLAAGTALAGPLTLNTGTAAWQVAQTSGATLNSASALGVDTTGIVLAGTLPFAANLPGFEAFAWVNPFGGAVWIGQRATDGQFTNGGSITCGSPCGATAGNYRYTLTFDASLGGDMIISGFTGDNGVRSLLVAQANNGTLYSCTAGGPGPLCPATQNTAGSGTGLLSLAAVSGGLVTITAVVENLDGPGRNPSGFILAGSARVNDAPAPVPEPSTLALLGLAAAAAVRRRLKS